MFDPQPFPERREELKKLHSPDSRTFGYAEAVLLAPRRGKFEQEVMLLQGSQLRTNVANSYPPKALRIRNHWETRGDIRNEGYFLVLTRDVHMGSVSIAAAVVAGRNIDGWDFWRYEGRNLERAWHCESSESEPIFYDPRSEMPPVPASAGRVFSVPNSTCGSCPRNTRLVETDQFSIFEHRLPKKRTLRLQNAHQSIIECRIGKVRVCTKNGEKELSPSNAIVLHRARVCEYKLVAAEDSVVTETVLNTS